MFYLNAYGYEYALDFGEKFHETMHRDVLATWKKMMGRYGG